MATVTRVVPTAKRTATRSAAAKSLITLATKTTITTTTQQIPRVAAATEKPAMPAATKKTTETVRKKITLAEFRRYKQWLAKKQKHKRKRNAAADGYVSNNRQTPRLAATTKTETPAIPVAKRSMMTTRKMLKTPAQVVR